MEDAYLISDNPEKTAKEIAANISLIYAVRVLGKGWSKDIAVALGNRQVWVLREVTNKFFVGRHNPLRFSSVKEAVNWLERKSDKMDIKNNLIVNKPAAADIWGTYASSSSKYKSPKWILDDTTMEATYIGELTNLPDMLKSPFRLPGDPPEIKHIQTNHKKGKFYTTVIWDDGSKPTVVKLSEDDQYDLYFAVASAIAIKLYGSNSAFKRMIKEKCDGSK